MVSNLPPPFRLSAHPHPRLFPAEPPPSLSFPPPNPLPTLLRSPPYIFNPHPLAREAKEQGRQVLTAARGTVAYDSAQPPLGTTPTPCSPTPRQQLPSTLDTLGFYAGEAGLPLGVGDPSPGRGPLQRRRGGGAPVPTKLRSCWKTLLKGGGLGGGAAPEPLGQGAAGKEEGHRSPLPPSFSAATQDEGPALPARAGAPPPGPGLTAPAPRPRPACRPPAGSPAPGCAEPPGG